MSVCLSALPSVCPHGTARLPLDRFPLNLISEDFFSKICRENPKFIKIWHEWRDLYMKTDVDFFIISRSVILRMRNVSDESCTENQNTHFVFNNLHPPPTPPPKILPIMRYCEKMCGANRQATDDNIMLLRKMSLSCLLTKARLHTHSHTGCW